MFQALRVIALFGLVSASVATSASAQYKARPVISALDPTAGPPGAEVKIVGRNFGPEYKVFYNGAPLVPSGATATQIVVRIPKDAVQGRFTLRGPIHQVVSPQVFWVVQPHVAPVIKEISPVSGAPGTVVTISGKHFSIRSHENVVAIGAEPMPVRSVSPTRIEAVIPRNAKTGNIAVRVYNAGNATSHQSFSVLAELRIDSVKPRGGPPGTKVTLVGSGFSSNKNANLVTLGGKKCKVLQSSSREIVVQVPPAGAVSGRFALDVTGLGTTEYENVFQVAYPPSVRDFDPVSGGIGKEVAIRGAHFGNHAKAVKVLLTGRECKILGVTDSEIRFRVPRGGVTGPLEIIVDGTGSAVSQKSFEVWAPLAVTRMEPLFGLPGTEVGIWGTGFRATPQDHSVIIGSKTVKIERIENGVLFFRIPGDAPDGEISLQLEVKDRGTTALAMPLKVLHSPEIVDFYPKRGAAGTVVTITGKHFGTKLNHLRLMLGNQIVGVDKVQPGSLAFTVPHGASSGKLEIQTVRRGRAQAKEPFEIFVPVVVTNFLPSMGYPGQVINLFGSGFDSKPKRNTVKLAGSKLKVIEASPTRLKVKLPTNAKPGKFRVEVPSRGSSETLSAFTVVEKLKIDGFSPKTGTPGTYVSISGQGFSNKGLRAYIGQKPIGVRVDSPTKATIAVPPGSMDGPFVFTAPGAGKANSTGSFKVLTPLTISGFQPSAGDSGTKVAIYGTGFDLRPKMTQVYYGPEALKAEPGSNDSMLIVTIPNGAKNSSFRVRVKDRGQAESEDIFSVYVQQAKEPAPQAPIASSVSSAPVQSIAPPAPAPVVTPPAVLNPPPSTTTKTQASMDDILKVKSNATLDGFEPKEGPVAEIVTINGRGFGEDISKVKVWIGKTPASVVGVVPDMIMIEVPNGVNRGKLRVKIGENPKMTTKKFFLVTK